MLPLAVRASTSQPTYDSPRAETSNRAETIPGRAKVLERSRRRVCKVSRLSPHTAKKQYLEIWCDGSGRELILSRLQVDRRGQTETIGRDEGDVVGHVFR